MTTQSQTSQASQSYDGWIGRDAFDQSGNKIGEITDIFYDDRTKRPEWVAVKTGLFGAKQTFVPIHGAQLRSAAGQKDDGMDEGLVLAFDKDQIKGAPKIDPDSEHMTPQEERELWSYYGYDYEVDPTARKTDYGYGTGYNKSRPDRDYKFNRYDDTRKMWTDNTADTQEHTEEVPVRTTAQVEVPVEANVRLRRYQTTQQKTRTVEVPYTETTEHTEVAGVDARTKGVTSVQADASSGKGQRVR